MSPVRQKRFELLTQLVTFLIVNEAAIDEMHERDPVSDFHTQTLSGFGRRGACRHPDIPGRAVTLVSRWMLGFKLDGLRFPETGQKLRERPRDQLDVSGRLDFSIPRMFVRLPLMVP